MHDPDGLPTDPFLDRLASNLQSLEGWGTFRSGARAAAVVAVLYRREGALYIPFVARRQDLPTHPGQIGLPGGMVRTGESAWQAAARRVAGARGGAAGWWRAPGRGGGPSRPAGRSSEKGRSPPGGRGAKRWRGGSWVPAPRSGRRAGAAPPPAAPRARPAWPRRGSR